MSTQLFSAIVFKSVPATLKLSAASTPSAITRRARSLPCPRAIPISALRACQLTTTAAANSISVPAVARYCASRLGKVTGHTRILTNDSLLGRPL